MMIQTNTQQDDLICRAQAQYDLLQVLYADPVFARLHQQRMEQEFDQFLFTCRNAARASREIYVGRY